jgi:Na+-transporting NADH:ubiquinone oxidoreductase subunit A
LLKSIVLRDTEEAQDLGILELDEEDLSLATYVCPSKYDYGSILRENLKLIEDEG